MKVNSNVLKLSFRINYLKSFIVYFLDEEYAFSIGLGFILFRIIFS